MAEKYNVVSHDTISSYQELISFLNEKKFSQRQDSTTDQIVDLIPVFKCLGFMDESKELSDAFGFSESIRYIDIINKIKFNDIINFKKSSVSIANLFGCYDAADFLKSF